MVLYGSTNSGHSYKVRSFLLLADIRHEYRWIDLGKPRAERSPDFVAASKFGEVPVLLDNRQALCQSNGILIYLMQKARRFSGHESERQAILEWLSWEANRIWRTQTIRRSGAGYRPCAPCLAGVILTMLSQH
jgi:glutathione S-transferase